MFKTLGLLAIAMMGTTALLGWIDPSPPIRARAVPDSQLLPLARSLVADDVSVQFARWRAVEILTNGRAVAPVLLTATFDEADYHFLVDVHGRPSRTDCWRYQRPTPHSPDAVRIQVATVEQSDGVSAAQAGSVRALVAALREAAARKGLELPVHIEPSESRSDSL